MTPTARHRPKLAQTTTTLPQPTQVDLPTLVTRAAALSAAAGGLIHFRVIADHLDFPLIAVGFGLMGLAQWVFAGTTLIRPSRFVLTVGIALHAAIAILWIISRTMGLGFIDGAEEPSAVGVADLAANTFSIAVIGAALIGLSLYRSAETLLVPASIATRVEAVVLTGVIFLTVPALLASHDHDHASVETSVSETGDGHDHATTPGTHQAEHDHGEGDSDTSTHP